MEALATVACCTWRLSPVRQCQCGGTSSIKSSARLTAIAVTPASILPSTAIFAEMEATLKWDSAALYRAEFVVKAGLLTEGEAQTDHGGRFRRSAYVGAMAAVIGWPSSLS